MLLHSGMTRKNNLDKFRDVLFSDLPDTDTFDTLLTGM
jgi:hypothetical protein